jgi:exodeoxyribonuclease VII small subunit
MVRTARPTILATGANNHPPVKKAKSEEPSFEEALEQLEAIVAAMEKGDVPLAELVSKYEDASKLLARCRSCLDSAAMTIERLREGKGTATEPFKPDGASAQDGTDD